MIKGYRDILYQPLNYVNLSFNDPVYDTYANEGHRICIKLKSYVPVSVQYGGV